MQPTSKKLRLTEVSPHLICALCGGYLIDATTIVECLHSFCKTCIVRYLESSKYCPICEVLVHKTRPLQNIRLDHTLQDIVYKLVPGLFKGEMQRRREYYKDSPTVRSAEVRQQQQRHRVIFSADEMFSVCLQFCPDGKVHIPVVKRGRKSAKETAAILDAILNTGVMQGLPRWQTLDFKTTDQDEHILDRPEKRYLLCPAGTTISHLKKFVRLKYSLSEQYQVDLFHAQGNVRDNYSLMDVAYIYSWKRDGVIQLYYSIFKEPVKIPKITITEVKDEPDIKSEETKPKSYFTECCDNDLPHDLSPLELIATVANGLSNLPDGRDQKTGTPNEIPITQERRGEKRDASTAGLYDDDASISNEIQIQKSIQHAIEVCSNNSNDKVSKDEVTNKNQVLDNSVQNIVKVEKDESVESNEQSKSDSKTTKPTEIKQSVQPEKPKKTDTASQCDPRPRKSQNKHNNNNSTHSRSHSKQAIHTKVQNGSITGSLKTQKDNKVAPDTEKKSKANLDQDKKLNNVKYGDKGVILEKLSKSSPLKQEKTVSAVNHERISQRTDGNKDSVRTQKQPLPQINGICSANEMENDKQSTVTKSLT